MTHEEAIERAEEWRDLLDAADGTGEFGATFREYAAEIAEELRREGYYEPELLLED